MTQTPHLAPEIFDYYTHAFDEAARLTTSADGALELLRTQEIARRRLPTTPARIIDIGGGAGVHAAWLVEDGYTVHLVDPIPRHIAQAERTGATTELGDARALTAADDTFDAALVLGPLYHLLDREDRDRALAEAVRVVRPGGLVFAAAISLYAPVFDHTATTWLERADLRDNAVDIIATHRHLPGAPGFTAAYFHTGPELVGELQAAGLEQVTVHGVEGPTWSLLKAVERHTGEALTDSPMFRAALTAARIAEPYPDLLSASSHLIAIGTV